jgi:hypothetical protein
MFKEMKTLTPDQQYDLVRKEATSYFSELGSITNAYFENIDRDFKALEEQWMADKLEQWEAIRNVKINNEAVNDQTMTEKINNEAVNEQTKAEKMEIPNHAMGVEIDRKKFLIIKNYLFILTHKLSYCCCYSKPTSILPTYNSLQQPT